MSGQADTYQHD